MHEGEVVVALDTVVQGTRFRPPRPLTDFRAIVRVSVSAACDGEAPSPDDYAPFLIDTGPLCVLGPLREGPETLGVIIWSAVPDAIEYESFFYQMPEGKLTGKAVSPQTAMRAPSGLQRPAVVAIRPRCASGYGDLQYLVLP